MLYVLFMNDATPSALSVANTVLAQLGGNRFLAMTGARDLMGSDTERSLQFKLPRGVQKGINAVRVVLDPSDTYTVTFYKIGRGYDVSTVAEVGSVFADSLRETFEHHTGLLTSL